MFVSEKGDGQFLVTLSNISPEQFEHFKNFPAENKLFLVCGTFKELANCFPVVCAQQIKYLTMNFIQRKYFYMEYLATKTATL